MQDNRIAMIEEYMALPEGMALVLLTETGPIELINSVGGINILDLETFKKALSIIIENDILDYEVLETGKDYTAYKGKIVPIGRVYTIDD